MRFLIWPEVEEIAAATVERLGYLVQLAALTGLRQGELFARFTIVIEFLVNLYLFPLLLELALVPIILGFIAMQVVAASNPSQAGARKLIDGILATIGSFLLTYVAVKALADPSSLFAQENMETLLIAPVMTFAFVPFLWVSGWISHREQHNVLKRFRARYDSTA